MLGLLLKSKVEELQGRWGMQGSCGTPVQEDMSGTRATVRDSLVLEGTRCSWCMGRIHRVHSQSKDMAVLVG